MSYKFTGNEIAEALTWLDVKGPLGLYQCDCTPVEDYEVNAVEHSESCAVHQEDHIQIMIRVLREAGDRVVAESVK